jgi:deoxyribodipyrimidine photo-lyase
MASSSEASRVLIYLLRRDLRLADNPIFHELSRLQKSKDTPPITHFLPIYIFSASQIEVSGFIPNSSSGNPSPSPYPECRSRIAGFWRCGPHRAKFLGESVWNLKSGLETLGSGLVIRVGLVKDVINSVLDGYKCHSPGKVEVAGIWMTEEESTEEKDEESDVREAAGNYGVDFRLFRDEKYYIDEYTCPVYAPPSKASRHPD